MPLHRNGARGKRRQAFSSFTYAGKQWLRTGPNEVTFEVRGRPGFISVDPLERRIEVERADDVRELSEAPDPR